MNIYDGGDACDTSVPWSWYWIVFIDARYLFHPLEACEKDTVSGTRG